MIIDIKYRSNFIKIMSYHSETKLTQLSPLIINLKLNTKTVLLGDIN